MSLLPLAAIMVYLQADKMLDENAKLDPISLYAESKVNSEKMLLEQLPKLQTTVLRCATAYGLASRVRFDLTSS